MPVITIVGAGPGLGLSIAKRFGRHHHLHHRRHLRQPRHDAGLRQHRRRCRRRRTYALSLHAAVADRGVHVAHVPLSVWIGSGGPETQPDTIAGHYWTIYEGQDGAEHPYVALP